MNAKPVLIIVFFILAGLGTYIWLDPGKPSASEAESAIRKALSSSPGATMDSVHVGRSFVGRRNFLTPSVRVWPVSAKVTPGGADGEKSFFVWKSTNGEWDSEEDNLLGKQWENRGYFGIF